MLRSPICRSTCRASAKLNHRNKVLSAAIAAAMVALPLVNIHAVDTTWTFDGNGNWNVPANWSNGEPINNTFDVFIDDGDTDVIVSLNVSRTINNLTIGDDDELDILSSQTLTLQGDTLDNAGIIDMLYVGGGFTDLIIDTDGAVTLSGGGTINMVLNTRITGLGAGEELIISDQTIQGAGGIGQNILTLTNQTGGLIDANVPTAGHALLIDPGAGNMTNAGIMQASNGGTMTLFGGTGSYNNTGGTIQALNGSFVNLLIGVSITGGTLDTAGTGVIQTANSATVYLDGVTNAGQFTINDNSDLYVSNTITNTGNIGFFSTVGNPKEIVLQTDNVTFDGGGTITLDDVTGQSNIRGDFGANRLTLTNQTVRGSGNLGNDTIVVTLGTNGQINANVAGRTLTVDPTMAAADDLGASGLTNGGLMQATNGGILALADGTYTNNTTIQADGTGSIVQLNNNSSTVGGTIQSINGAVVQTATSASVGLDGVTINGQLNIRDNTDLDLSNTINNNGDIGFLHSAGNAIEIVLQTDNVTLTGGGTITLDNVTGQSNIRDDSGERRLTLDNQTVQGSGNIGNNTLVMTLNANGVIDANVNARTLTVDPTAGLASDGGANGLTNNGLMQATNGGILALADGTYTNNTTIQADGTGSIVQLNNNSSTVGGTIQSINGAVVQTATSASVGLDGVTINGKLNIRDNTDLDLSNTINNTGDIAFLPSAGNPIEIVLQTDNVTLTGGGTVTLNNTVGAANIRDDSGVRRLTLDNQTVQGSGNLGDNTIVMTLNANGGIHANVSGRTLFVDPDQHSSQ